VIHSIKVSIITSTFNSAATIADTLESIAGQSYSNIEHIIVDGLSKDDTLSIVSAYPHVAMVVSENDKGIYDAMNKGIYMATGDIIGILNSDDFYVDASVVQDIADIFAGDPDIQCVYADLNYVSQNDTTRIVRRWKSGNYTKESFRRGWMPPHPTFFVRKQIYDRCGVFNLQMGTAADYEIMLRILEKHRCKAAYLPRIIIHMRTGGASNQSLKARWKAHQCDRLAWKINDLKPSLLTLFMKPIRKLIQFV